MLAGCIVDFWLIRIMCYLSPLFCLKTCIKKTRQQVSDLTIPTDPVEMAPFTRDGEEGASTLSPARFELVAGVFGPDDATDILARAHHEPREHPLALGARNLWLRRLAIARLLFRQTPGLRCHLFLPQSCPIVRATRAVWKLLGLLDEPMGVSVRLSRPPPPRSGEPLS